MQLLQGWFVLGVATLVICSPVMFPVRVRLLVAEPESDDRITFGRWRPQKSESNTNANANANANGFVRLFARGSSNRRVWPADTISNVISANDFGERTGPTTTTTSRPRQGPSPCVWAIVSCCNPGSRDFNDKCFQALGCSGPFWDGNPCEPEFGLAAINSAQKHFGVSTSTESEFDFHL